MHAITITLAPGHAQATLHYRKVEAMMEARQKILQARTTAGALFVSLHDDFSRLLEVALKDILAVCYFEIETGNESTEAAGLLHQQAQARLNKKWFADPLFKSLQAMAQLATGGTMPGGRQQ